MGYTPDLDWLDAFAAQCMLVAAEFSQKDWTVVVWSLAAIAEAEQARRGGMGGEMGGGMGLSSRALRFG